MSQRRTPLSLTRSNNLGCSCDADIFSLREPDIPRALVYLYQAATQNDSLAQLALGYRHAYGLGVLKSCSIAAAYYGAVAETVVKDVGSQKYSPFKTYRVTATQSHASFGVSILSHMAISALLPWLRGHGGEGKFLQP